MQQRRSNGFLVWEWLLALTLLGSFALLAVTFIQRQESQVLQQQQLRQQAKQEAIQVQRGWLGAGHQLLFELQEGG